MSGQRETFEAVTDFLEKATQNNHSLRRAIDCFVERLEILEHVSTITEGAKSSQVQSCRIERTQRLVEFHKALERYQVANIEATQALAVAACISKAIAESEA